MPAEYSMREINGVDLKVVPIDGPKGRFSIAFAGARKESDDGFYYEDERGHFGFYGRLQAEPNHHWVVTGATTGVWTGMPFKTTRENEAIFRQNILFFFNTRSWTGPHRPGDESSARTPVTFAWSIL